MDKIIIKGLKLDCIIGVNEWERNQKQPVIIDITAYVDVSKAAKTDNLDNAINYKEIYDLVVNLAKNSHFYLVETLAQEIANACLKNFKIKKIKVKILKPEALKLAESAGVEIVREK